MTAYACVWPSGRHEYAKKIHGGPFEFIHVLVITGYEMHILDQVPWYLNMRTNTTLGSSIASCCCNGSVGSNRNTTCM